MMPGDRLVLCTSQVPVPTLLSSLSSVPDSNAKPSDFIQLVRYIIHQGLGGMTDSPGATKQTDRSRIRPTVCKFSLPLLPNIGPNPKVSVLSVPTWLPMPGF